MSDERTVDVAVVGGGTAGSLVAGLLSGTDRSVRLFEEGPDETHPLSRRLADQPQLLRSEALRRMPERRPGGGGATLLSGRLIGGGWSVNHGVMMMPTEGDLRAMAEAGGSRWSIDHLRSLAGRITTDRDRVDVPEGSAGTGPIPLERPLLDRSVISPATAALLEACEAMGVPWTADVNTDPSSVSISSYAYSSDHGDRVSSATAVLGPARDRSNLSIAADTQVRRLVLSGSRVVAIEVAPAGGGSDQAERVEVDRVILSAGVFHSPQILLRSGIGPREHLRDCRIDQVMELPGVGSGLRDHAKFEFEFELSPRDEDRAADGSEPWAADSFGDRNKVHLRLKSSLATDDPDLDLQLRHDVDRRVMILTTRILEQRAPGTVRLDPDDTIGLPHIDSGMLRDEEDVQALVEGIRLGIEILLHPTLQGRYRLAGTAPHSDGAWRDAVLSGYSSYNHGVGTCRMGVDRSAVVDQELRVHGVDNLFIVDGSVLPVLPHVTTNYPVAIVAQWAAEHYLRTW